MSKSWGPHDIGGQEGGPIDLSEHDTAHWEWQIDAMVRLALSKGLISDFAELRDGIEHLTQDDYDSCTYYERWAKSLAYTLISRGVISEQGPFVSTPLFNVGQRVRIADRTPPVHHRVPAYAKGQVGVIERVCKLHGEPEKFIRGDGKPPQRLYRVRIPQNDLWQEYAGTEGDDLDIEIFEHWLEPME